MTTQSKALEAKETILTVLDDAAKSHTEDVSKWTGKKPNKKNFNGMNWVSSNILDTSDGWSLEGLTEALISCDDNLGHDLATCFQYKHQVRQQLRNLMVMGLVESYTVPGKGKRLFYRRTTALSIFRRAS